MANLYNSFTSFLWCFLHFFARPNPESLVDMRLSAISTAVLPLTTAAVNVVLSNDDGWAEINIREFYSSLTKAGFNVVLSAPAENESGTGSSDSTPTTVGSTGCEFSSCPAGSPAYGKNASMPRFNVYVARASPNATADI
jgi:hypothetical protein